MIDVLGAGSAGDICSRAGCSDAATNRIDWRNPRIHTEERTKTWLACEVHVAYLQGFLEARSFPVTVTRFSGETGDAS